MKLGSLFDGSGGFPLAGAICGIEPVWASEIEPFPIRVTTKRFPHVKHLGSVTDVNGAEIEPVDIITFGSPCQDLSVAGKRKGIHDGERSSLFFEAIRIIKEMREHDRAAGRADVDIRPRYIVWENVFGAFSSNSGDDFRCVLEEICKVADPEVSIPRPDKGKWQPAGCIMGGHYSVAWRTFDAQYWGVPQRRRRIYLVADFAGERAGGILFEQDGMRGNSQESGATREGTAADAEGSAGGSVGVKCLNPWDCQSKRQFDVNGVYPTLQAMGDGGGRSDGIVYPVTSPENECEIAHVIDSIGGQAERSLPGDIAPCLKASHYKFAPVICAAFKGGQGADARTIGYDENASPTLNATPSGSNQVPDVVYALQANGIDRAETAGCNGCGWREDQCYTLNTIDRHAVAFDCRNLAKSDVSGTLQAKDNGGWSLNYVNPVVIDRAAYNQGINAQYDPQYSTDGIVPTVIAKGPSAVCYDARGNGDGRSDPTITGDHNNRITDYTALCIGNGQADNTDLHDLVGALNCMHDQQAVLTSSVPSNKRKYIVRRLTPVECARLQGFPDWWCMGLETPDPTEDDIAWAADVWEVWRKATAPNSKPKSRNQLIKWLKQPYSDAAEYKLWGNGIALPCAVRVMEGIAKGADTHD